MLVLTVVCSMLDNRVLAHRPTVSHLGPNMLPPLRQRCHHTGAEAERNARRPALSDGSMPFAPRVQDCGRRSTTIDANTTCTTSPPLVKQTNAHSSIRLFKATFDANEAVRTQDSGVQHLYSSRTTTLAGSLDLDRAESVQTKPAATSSGDNGMTHDHAHDHCASPMPTRWDVDMMGTRPINHEATEAGYRTCGADNGDDKENHDPNSQQNKIMPLRKTKTMSMPNATADHTLVYVTTGRADVRSVMRALCTLAPDQWCHRSPAARHAIAIALAPYGSPDDAYAVTVASATGRDGDPQPAASRRHQMDTRRNMGNARRGRRRRMSARARRRARRLFDLTTGPVCALIEEYVMYAYAATHEALAATTDALRHTAGTAGVACFASS